MKKKNIIAFAAIWLICLGLAACYTKDASWTFEAENLSEILTAQEDAQRAEEAAQAKLDAAQQEARALQAAGEWKGGRPVEEAFLPAVSDGLNLMWGAYRTEVEYASEEPFELSVVSPGRQSFVKGGRLSLQPGEGTAVWPFDVTDAAPHVRVASSSPDAVRVVTVHRETPYRDNIAYGVLLAGVLSVLYALKNDSSKRGKGRRQGALVVLGAAAFASLPLLLHGLYGNMDHDLFFHLNRIEGIASGLRAGQFPVRIHASTMLGYGYAAPIFYPEVFLYIPAVLRNLGVSLAGSVRIFEMLINLAAAAVCYMSTNALFRSRRTAAGATVLYTLCIYRLATLYTRAALGESLAMIFFPLMILAMAEVLTRDERRWPLLALAMTGVCMSHLLSTLFCAGLCALAALCAMPRLIKEPHRILAILKAAGVTVLCILFFYVPMLSYTAAGVNASVALNASKNALQPGSFLMGFSGKNNLPEDFAYTIGVVPGLAILVGCGLFAVRRYAAGHAQEGDGPSLFLLVVGGALLLAATDLFPWAFLCGLPSPYSTLFMQIQFPWRLAGMAAPLLCMAAARGYDRPSGTALLLALTLVFSGYALQSVVQDTPILTQDGFCDTRVPQNEYTYAGTEKTAFRPGEIRVASGEQVIVEDYEKRGTNLSFALTAQDGRYIEVPLLYYPGYRAEIDGRPCTTERGENGLLRIYGGPGGQTVQVSVRFVPPVLWRAAEAASLLGAGLLVWVLLKRRRA